MPVHFQSRDPQLKPGTKWSGTTNPAFPLPSLVGRMLENTRMEWLRINVVQETFILGNEVRFAASMSLHCLTLFRYVGYTTHEAILRITLSLFVIGP